MTSSHRFNNKRIGHGDSRERILDALADGQPQFTDDIAQRISVGETTVRDHANRLVACGLLTRGRINRRIVYAKPAVVVVNRRAPSVEYAGYRTVGRGLARW